VPTGLQDVSNGRLRKVTDLKNGLHPVRLVVANPINNYDIEATIGKYTHFGDTYAGEKGKLTLDYWVLTYNVGKAKKTVWRKRERLLKSFEHWFGPILFMRTVTN